MMIVKKLMILFPVLAVLVLSACSHSGKQAHLEYREPEFSVDAQIGYLKVHTHRYVAKKEFIDDSDEFIYSSYAIYTTGGELVKRVGSSSYSPKTVRLKAGEYVVVGKLTGDKVSSFKTTIQAGLITEIDQSVLSTLETASIQTE